MNSITVAVAGMKVRNKVYPIKSIDEAQRMFIAARDRSGHGVSRTPAPLLLDAAGNLVGYISYNGRAWAGDPRMWTKDMPLLAEAPRA